MEVKTNIAVTVHCNSGFSGTQDITNTIFAIKPKYRQMINLQVFNLTLQTQTVTKGVYVSFDSNRKDTIQMH